MQAISFIKLLWSFDDLSTATTVNVVKKFNTPGIQNVNYKVFANNGCIGDTTKQVTIFDSPIANFGATTTICQKDSVMLTDTSTISIGTINSWHWNFGDGQTFIANNNNPLWHHYNSPGTYTISLIASSNNGCKSDTAFRQVNVLATPVTNWFREIFVVILFRDSSIISSGSIVSWQWIFGDAITSTVTNSNPFYHTYSSAGSYLVKLVVLSNNGCVSDTFSLTVIVANKPVAAISRSGTLCIDSLQSFVSSFRLVLILFHRYWDFGDGQTFNSTTSNLANHSYSTSLTNITIKHVVSIGQGCASDTAFYTIPAIYPNPGASFTIIADTACVNKPIQLNSTNTGIASWNWNFANGTGNNVPPFTHSYSNAGNYTVSLKVISTDGCGSSPASQSISIYPNPLINAGPDKFITPGGNAQINAINSTGNWLYMDTIVGFSFPLF
jgi:PKD repeat protein